ncbi:MAG: 23S rRNA (guanosine(2251)-2'-O)-methyltransferase RlmB [Gammaproteobacteria bacterium]|nr:MAG: 23S rRNA (guanosine(2251)-2'-O)-methyltransferase RlmB [Gammaproteobacteria bacterium]
MNSPRSQWIAGIHAVRGALGHGAERVHELLVDRRRQDKRLRSLVERATALGVPVRQVERAELDRLADGATHQGVLARSEAPAARNEQDLDRLLRGLSEPAFLLILDGVTDPHNLGACLRTADAVGVHAVIAPADRSAGLTPVACKVASGAAETVPLVQVKNLARTLKRLQEEHRVFLVGTAGEAKTSLFDADLTGPLGMVMGAEGRGLRRLTREQCDQLVCLPMRGTVESLNVSVATGVCLYEGLRQRSISG